ncbi:MAG: trigger factor [Patescibacteria group bacterium]|nr:trigger factor [Patescibacteria group bacterium]
MTKTKTKKTTPKTSKLDSKLTWLPKKTFSLEFSIPWSQVKKTTAKAIDNLSKTAKLTGFRKGKAPKKLVKKSIDTSKLYGEVINQLLPISYSKAVKTHHLRPAISPKIQIIKAEENQAWEFKATSCELPEIKLGDYKKIAKGALAKSKIWTPKKGLPKKQEKPQELSDTQKFNLVLKALMAEIKLELPDLLIDKERDRLLSRLLDQIQKLKLTIDQYATSNNKTVNQIKQEYKKSAEETLKMELIMQTIVNDLKLEVKDKEIDKMIDQAGDETVKQKLNTPQERAYIASILKKRQAIDRLISL